MRIRASHLLPVLALAAAAVALVVVLRGSSGYELNAVFDQVPGLVKGADVRVAGFNVGRVEEITLGPDGLPHVRMRIGDSYRLHRGATADLRAISVAGEVNRFVAVTSGSGPALPDGATIGLARSDEPVEVDQVLSTLDPRTRANVRATLAGLDAATRGRGGAIAATLRHSADALGNTAALLGEVTADGHALRALVSDGSATMRALAAAPDALGGTADQLAGLLRTTGAREAQLARTATLLPAGLHSPRAALERLDASLPRIDRLVRVAAPGVRELVPFATALRPTLAAARPALRQLSSLTQSSPADVRALEPLLADAKPLLRTLAPALDSANPILDQLRVRLPDFFSFFSNWADFTGNYDANGHAARVGIVLPPAPLNTIGPDDAGAGHLRAPFVRDPGTNEGTPWKDYAKSFIGGGEQP